MEFPQTYGPLALYTGTMSESETGQNEFVYESQSDLVIGDRFRHYIFWGSLGSHRRYYDHDGHEQNLGKD